MQKLDISKVSKARLLAALYNNSKPLGLGFLHYTPEHMTEEQAAELLQNQTYFDYLKGRVMKVDLSGDELYPGGYDMDNGDGACEKILRSIS